MALRATSTNRLRAAALACALALGAGEASATPSLVVDVDTGQTLFEREATAPWYPASLTKLMTTYVALQAVRDGRLTLDTPLTMSARAANMPASKMGFRPGVEVTLDNALKMLMVKSPNDVAVMIAESVSGSVEAFADEMNATGRRLGLKESHFVNPNGLHNPAHVSSARDMAMIGRALLKDFPEHSDLFDIGALQLGDEIIPNHNGLLGRYPGADGMKTGFTCPAGFNVVASATQGGRRLIVVVLGSPSARAAHDRSGAFVRSRLRQMGRRRGRAGKPAVVERALGARYAPGHLFAPQPRRHSRRRGGGRPRAGRRRRPEHDLRRRNRIGSSPPMTAEMAAQPVHFDPVPVFVGPKPGWTGPVLAARAPDKAPADGSAPIASAYAGDKPSVVEGADTQSAPIALQGALRPTKPDKSAASASLAPPGKGGKAAAPAKTAVHASAGQGGEKER